MTLRKQDKDKEDDDDSIYLLVSHSTDIGWCRYGTSKKHLKVLAHVDIRWYT